MITKTHEEVSSLYLSQEVEKLNRLGYIDAHAKTGRFRVVLKAIRRHVPNALSVEKTGPNCNRQFIYLPRSRRKILSILNSEVREYAKASKSTLKAISKIHNDRS